MRHLQALQRDPLEFLTGLTNRFGDAVGLRVGPRLVALFRHPEAIEEVLVKRDRFFTKGRALQRAKRVLGEGLLTSEGAHHLRQRRLAQPAFHRDRIATYADSMASLAAERSNLWRPGERFDIAAEMNRVTLAIVTRTLFGADIGDRATEVRDALTTVIEMFDLQASPVKEWLDHFPLPRVRRFRAAQAKLDAVIYRLIADRRSQPGDGSDLLSLLLAARDVADDGEGMTDQQLRDEAITVFLAGHETTANALTWTWWLLGGHPDVERQFHAELADVLGSRVPGIDDVARLSYTRMILAEAMRLYPPAWLIGRRAVQDVEIAGFRVRAGSIVLVSQWITHRDERFFFNPGAFVPERWSGDEHPPRPRYAYFPFGGGSRVCIGESFAWMEGVLALATIGQRWRLVRTDESPVRLLPKITLRPDGPLWMVAERR